MERKWFIRPYQDGDEEAIYDLRCAVFGEIQDKEQWLKTWNWKYKNNPAGNPVIWVALAGDKLVANYAVIPVKMKIGDEIIEASQSVDTMTHPEYQGQGIFLELTRQVFSDAGKQGKDIIYGFPNKMTSWHQKNWLDVGELYAMMKPLNLKGILGILVHNRLIINILAAVGNLVINLISRVKIPPEVDGLKINRISSFDERINDLWQKVSNDYQIMVVRDKEYLNWRFVDVPGGDYTIYIAEIEGQVLGYTVVKCEEYSELKIGRIFELTVPSGQQAIAQALILKAIEFFDREKADFILYRIIGNKAYHRVLKKCGFINSHFLGRIIGNKFYNKILKIFGFIKSDYVSSYRFVARSNTAKVPGELLKDHRNWLVQTGDSDYV